MSQSDDEARKSTRSEKAAVRDYWDAASCGEVYAMGTDMEQRYDAQRYARFQLEPYILDFAQFARGRGRDVLEIGVGMGADHSEWARSEPRSLTGIDLTKRAIQHTRARFTITDRSSLLFVGDAEHLPLRDESYDLVYSWGVIHHSPDTGKAVSEIHRVLRTGGEARIMIYHDRSVVGALLWLRYALLGARPRRGLRDVYAEHLESPGTKAFSVREARRMFAAFSRCQISTGLSFGDLLMGAAGQRHHGILLEVARKLWPRWLIRRCFKRYGLMLLIDAVK